MKRIILTIAVSAFLASAYSQNCISTTELISLPGKLEPANPKLPPVSDFSQAEKALVFKTMSQIEPLLKKDFFLEGGTAKYWFHNQPDINYFGQFYCTNYFGQIGFYPYVCVNGKIINASEFTAEFRIMANPDLNKNLFDGGADYYRDDKKKSGSFIPFCSYQLINDEEAEKIIGGNGFLDVTHGNNYAKHTDVYRHWYISKPGMPILVKVSRKEFLVSLLEFFEREKKSYSKDFERRKNDAIQYMEKYKANGNNIMFQNSADDKEKAESALETIEANYRAKKQPVENMLKNNDLEWLNQPAVLDHKRIYCDENYGDKTQKHAKCFALESFYEGKNGLTVYQWNPEVFKQSEQKPGKAIFFDVMFRYHAGEDFSENILNNFVRNFDFEALKKLLD